MKSYKDFERHCIGTSDIAKLVIVGCNTEPSYLAFGGDDTYLAYIVTEEAEIGGHYSEVYRCSTWIKIYDDAGLTLNLRTQNIGDPIVVYRAGERGTIIYAPGGRVETFG